VQFPRDYASSLVVGKRWRRCAKRGGREKKKRKGGNKEGSKRLKSGTGSTKERKIPYLRKGAWFACATHKTLAARGIRR